MKITSELIKELGEILNDEFQLPLEKVELEKLAYSIVGYVDLLLKLDQRKVRNCPASLIDNHRPKEDDR